MKIVVVYKVTDIEKIKEGDVVKIARIVSSDTFFRIIKKRPSKIEISQSVLDQSKRINSIIRVLEITKEYLPKIKIKKYK